MNEANLAKLVLTIMIMNNNYLPQLPRAIAAVPQRRF